MKSSKPKRHKVRNSQKQITDGAKYYPIERDAAWLNVWSLWTKLLILEGIALMVMKIFDISVSRLAYFEEGFFDLSIFFIISFAFWGVSRLPSWISNIFDSLKN